MFPGMAKEFPRPPPLDHMLWSHEDATGMTPTQIYDVSTPDALGRPLMTQYGDRHTTGQAVFTGDQRVPQMLYAIPLLSPHAHAKIVSIDTSAALALPGVHGWVDKNDVPGVNQPSISAFGTPDDEISFADGEVTSHGQIIGGILAETAQLGRQAVQLVKVVYEVLSALTDFAAAIEKKSFMCPPMVAQKNATDLDEAIAKCEFQLKGWRQSVFSL